jgi:flagellar L-ring protein precursor FlgH
MTNLLKRPICLLFPALLAACAAVPIESDPNYAPMAMEYPEAQIIAPTGAIYAAGRGLTLFEDIRASQVGDIVTIVLAEATNAAKSSDTSLDKSNSNSIIDPVLAGQTRVLGIDSSLAFDLSSDHSFGGESASNQRNSLQGSITVTVARILPGGNLYVQGEKWIHINQGNEYIRLRGVIRPVDVSTNNTVLSTKVADARISYGGTGATAEVNGVGWLSRFFMSPIWPF